MRILFLPFILVLPVSSAETLFPAESPWRATTDLPPQNWLDDAFDPSGWESCQAPFGPESSFPWTAGQLWLVRSFELDEVPEEPQLSLRHRGEVRIWVNGRPVADFRGETPGAVPVPVEGEAFGSLKPGRNRIGVELSCIGEQPLFSLALENATSSGAIDAPLYRDPRFDGAADPMVVWNRGRKCWTMFYSQRRSNRKHLPGVGYCYGNDIGTAVSYDGGRTWAYDGIARGLEFRGGRNTWWAPEVVGIDGTYHMWVSYIEGVHFEWTGPATMYHYTSGDLKHWTFSDELPMRDVIDACLFPLPSGGWRMFYKQDSKTFMTDSRDLKTWEARGVAAADAGQEGPNVFRWKDRYWMIADVWHGQQVYESPDLTTWKLQQGPTLLGVPGTRRDDGAFGRHADVIVQGDRAFILYFTHPGGDRDHDRSTSLKRTSVQVAELKIEDGRLTADRNQPLDYHWDPKLLDW